MNMGAESPVMDLVVFAALAFAAVFCAAWLVSPRLREKIERPKHAFRANLQTYAEDQGSKHTGIHHG